MDASKPTTQSKTVIAEHVGGDEWMILWDDGSCEHALSAKIVLKKTRDRDAKLSKKKKAIIVTKLEWRNAPKGFTPPSEGA